MLEPGRNCWRVERACRATLIVDAADYFRTARQAMLRAEKQILLIGWDFDTRICLDFEADDGAPAELGAFLSWLSNRRPELRIYILQWNIGAFKLLGRGTTVLRVGRWAMSDRIHFKLDGAHPPGASHHQKIVVIDDGLAFCGGIDMTAERWDTRGHLDDDKHRQRPTTRRSYGPWHDASMAVDGRAAVALGDLARERWASAGGKPIDAPQPPSAIWPEDLKPDFRDVDVAIGRTEAAYDGAEAIREIEALFLDMIEQASRFVYAENQYFTSRAVAEAIARRLREPDPPEFILINPRTGESWLDDEVMSSARAELLAMIREADAKDRFRIYSPVTAGGEDIYVHSKVMIVDDRLIRVGSANLNNRSMGLDSECDLLIDFGARASAGGADELSRVRTDLLAEHLGQSARAVHKQFLATGSLIRTIEHFAGSEGRGLKPLCPKTPNSAERALVRSEVLDPESAGTSFEPPARPGFPLKLGW